MRLSQIKLSGFKSFADATVIRVPGQRVGVVGPNGCGKSNVIDAVRWVLGEASAKQLRGESMQDVIFNGASTRTAASRAAVELVFDNSDFALSGAWGQFSEVAIKRTLNRNGDSAYFINNQQVRRRDITDLFLGTGVGARGYAVIEQGMISRIIEAKPEELRGFIEEAAGVSKYKERRRETENRLKETTANLARLADLQSELDRQAEKLQRQAQTAARYQSIKAELNLAQNRLDYLLWQNALDEADAHMQQHNQAQAAVDTLEKEQTVINEQIYRLQLEEYDSRERETQWTQQRAVVREEAARLEEQIRHQVNLRQRREREQMLAQTEIDQIAQRLLALQEQAQTLAEEVEHKQFFAEETRLRCEQVAEALPQLRERADAIARSHDEHKTRVMQLQQTLALHRQNHARNQSERQRLQQRLPESTGETTLPDFAAAESQVALLQLRHETMQQRIEEEEAQLAGIQAALNDARAQQQAMEKQRAVWAAEHAALSAMLPEGEAANDDFWQHFPQVQTAALWQQIEVEITWQHALSVALAERLHARCAPDFAPNELPAGRAAWVNRTPERLPENLPDNALLKQVLHVDESFQAALNYWLSDALCADSVAAALQAQHDLRGGQYFLTPEGHRIDRVGVTLYGAYDAAPLLARQARIKELAAAQEAAQAGETEAAAHSDSLQDKLERLQENLEQERRLAHSLATQWRSAADELFKNRTAAEAQQQRLLEKQQESARLQADMAALDEDDEQLAQQIEEAEIQLFAAEDDIMASEETLTRARLQWEQAQEKVLVEERQANQAEMAARHSVQQLATLTQEQNMLQARREALRHKQDELSLHEEETDDDETQRNRRLATLGEQEAELAQTLNTLNQQQKQLKNSLDAAQRQAQQLSARLPETRQQQQTAALAAQQAQLTGEHHRNNLQERGADLAALSANSTHGQDAAALNQTITDTARRLNNLGAVNLAALDELAETEERRAYLQAQREDVHNAMTMLQEAIAQIDNESKKLFKQTFDAVNQHMQRYFPVLFGGGEAALTLTDSDLLQTGISITARPPGKKNSTIHLLSGGEKALTAMSLVFSLFSLNPAPFCLLDEVDAPLDDANTGRFCKLVTEMSEHTQFLYISHNRLTMEMAEQLIGVTMQEKGVSRIVSVDVQAALAMAEA
ncbi:MAG: chromosome segregation protein SMC [Neisseria sp.]|nr:chromosome segregation protein SMC [Neisseria sp.]